MKIINLIAATALLLSYPVQAQLRGLFEDLGLTIGDEVSKILSEVWLCDDLTILFADKATCHFFPLVFLASNKTEWLLHSSLFGAPRSSQLLWRLSL